MAWFENLFSQGTVERLGWMLVHFLWQATVVAVLLAAFLRLLQKSSADVRYLTACAALAMMVVLPVATIQLIEVPGPAAEAGPEPALSAPAEPLPPASIVETSDEVFVPSDVALEIVDVTTPVSWSERIASALQPALPYAVLGWLVGVFGLSAWHLGGWMQLQRLKRRMVRRVSAALQEQLTQVAGRLGVHRVVTLLESALVEVPTVVGWLRPVILLPASALTGLSPEQLEAILAHELAHIRRYDYLVNVVQTVVEILGFYHPAVWWVSRRIRIERENCCDDTAVRLCGDSIRYARALTCLEEIRHSQADLAMAATGGSLLDRIARLLGRPATDARRFAWLPGLIALLLVGGIVIPTALALAAPDRRLPELPSPDPALTSTPDETEVNEPPHTQVFISYTLVEVSADRTLDPQTAAEARELLLRLPPPNVRRVIGPLPQPTIEELQRPLAQALAGVTPARHKDAALVELLVSRGYARVLSKPKFLLFAGQTGTVMVGQAEDANAPIPQEGQPAGMRLNTTAHPLDDPNSLLVETRLALTYPADVPGDPNAQTTTTEITSTGVMRDDEPSAIIERSTAQEGEAARKRLHIVLVQPKVVYGPETGSPGATDEPAASEPDAAEEDKARVQVGVKIVKAMDSSELDPETVLKIEKVLGKRVRPEGRAGEFGPRFRLTLGEVLRNHVVGQLLPSETVNALLPLFKDIEVLAAPRVTARDGEKSQVNVVSYEYVWMGSSTDGSSRQSELQKVEIGTKVDLTAHVGDHNAITVEIGVELSDLLPRSASGDVPTIRKRSTKATVTTLNDQYITIAGTTADEQSVYIMAIPTLVEAPTSDNETNEITFGVGGMGGFGDLPGEINARVLADPAANEQRVQLQMQYLTSDPMYQEFAKQVAQIEVELIRDGQKYLPEHPQMVEKRALLDTLKKRLEDRRETLKQEFEEQINRQTETRIIPLTYIRSEDARNLLPQAFKAYVKPVDSTEPNSHTLIVTAPPAVADRIVAEIQRIDVPPRKVLLDFRIVAAHRRDLLNLGIEWAQVDANRPAQGSLYETDIRVGYLFDRVSSDSLMVKLDQLRKELRLDILAKPQVMARDGRRSKLETIAEDIAEWSSTYTVSIVPVIDGNDDISLDLTYDYAIHDLRSGDQDAMSWESPKSMVTVHDGGTVALVMWKLSKRPDSEPAPMASLISWLWPRTAGKDMSDSERVIACFVRASLVERPGEAAPGSSEATEAKGEESVLIRARPVVATP